MKNIKNTSTFVEKAFTLFMTGSKANRSTTHQIYWVIEENEISKENFTVKYYDENDRLLFKESVEGLQDGVIDSGVMYHLNRTKKDIMLRLM